MTAFQALIKRHINDASISCETGNDFNGALPLRISSIFVILLGSLAGILFPLLARPSTSTSSSHPSINPPNSSPLPIPKSTFKITIRPPLLFALKHFGSGILLATAFIHLLAPASDALRNPCLTGVITEYPWVEGIVLITIVGTFFVEILVDVFAGQTYTSIPQGDDERHLDSDSDSPSHSNAGLLSTSQTRRTTTNHQPSSSQNNWKPPLTRLLLLESSIILHSLLIGLSLSVAGPEFPTLYAVLIFHQTFEGLGLGTRLAEIPWPTSKQYTPYMLGVAYALSTPLAITVGLCVRGSYSPGSQGVLIVSGVFDSVSAGVLIYSGLVEVMAREFLFNSHGENQEGRGKDVRSVFAAFFWLCVGAAAMAVLGKWA
ncbi:Zinc/iron permease [Aspergillus spectabilis]